MTVKETLHQIVDALSDDQAEELLDFLNLCADPDTLAPEELARVAVADAELTRGEFVTLDEIRRRLDA
jgi:hypothetical protein